MLLVMLLLVSSILILAISIPCIIVVDVLLLHAMVAVRMPLYELFPVRCIAVAFVPVILCARI